MSTKASSNPLSFLYNHNPFYFLGTLAVLYGLHSLQTAPASDGLLNPLILPTTLAFFVIGLTAIGIAIVRFGGVWEDARSIILSVLLIAFAVSVCIDTFCLSQPLLAAKYSIAALVFFIGISESIIRGVRIRLPAGYRLPFYLLLGLMFLYPLVFASDLIPVNRENASWLIYGFSLAVSIAILTLLPAVARRKRYVANNGTPWS